MWIGLEAALFGWLATYLFRAATQGTGHGRALDYLLGITFAVIGVKAFGHGDLAERATAAPWIALASAAAILLCARVHRTLFVARRD